MKPSSVLPVAGTWVLPVLVAHVLGARGGLLILSEASGGLAARDVTLLRLLQRRQNEAGGNPAGDAEVDLNEIARQTTQLLGEYIKATDFNQLKQTQNPQDSPGPGDGNGIANEALAAIEKAVNTTDFNKDVKARALVPGADDGLARRDLGPCATTLEQFQESILNVEFAMKSALKVALNPLCGIQAIVSDVAYASGHILFKAANDQRAKRCRDRQPKTTGATELKALTDKNLQTMTEAVSATDFNKLIGKEAANSTLAGADFNAFAKEALGSYSQVLKQMNPDQAPSSDATSAGSPQKRAAVGARPRPPKAPGGGNKGGAKPPKEPGKGPNKGPKKPGGADAERIAERQQGVTDLAVNAMTCAVTKIVIREGSKLAVEQGKAIIAALSTTLETKAAAAAKQSVGPSKPSKLLPFLPVRNDLIKAAKCDLLSESCIGSEAFCGLVAPDEAKCLAERDKGPGA